MTIAAAFFAFCAPVFPFFVLRGASSSSEVSPTKRARFLPFASTLKDGFAFSSVLAFRLFSPSAARFASLLLVRRGSAGFFSGTSSLLLPPSEVWIFAAGLPLSACLTRVSLLAPAVGLFGFDGMCLDPPEKRVRGCLRKSLNCVFFGWLAAAGKAALSAFGLLGDFAVASRAESGISTVSLCDDGWESRN